MDELPQLVAVSKKKGPDRIREAAEAGLDVFGENKVQEARAKIPLCSGNLHWHMIGHLQSNKVKWAVRLFEMIHSVDSLSLLQTIDNAAGQAGVTPRVLLEINVSGEPSKFGLTPEATPAVLEASTRLMHIELAGLMTMAPFAEDPQKARPHFARLRTLRDEWRQSTGIPLDDLSMGMSHDFEGAVEEGSTWVRIGTALFGER